MTEHIFFTSDVFFGRTQKASEREFQTSNEMDDYIIDKWVEQLDSCNNTGDDKMTIYSLGNLGWDPISTNKVLNTLFDNFTNLNIIFLKGDYDYQLLMKSKYIKTIDSSYCIDIVENHNIILSYYPLLEYPGMIEGYINIHGYNSKTYIEKDAIRINCSLDRWDYNLVSLDTVKDIIDLKMSKCQ